MAGMTTVSVTIDGTRHTVNAATSIAAVLLAQGRRAWRTTSTGERRGVFCGIGTCFDCTLKVDGREGVRACITPVRNGMTIATDIEAP